MVISIALILLALAWLLYETKYLTIRLLIGPESIEYMPEPIRKSWSTLIWGLSEKQRPNFVKMPDHFQPICGMQWLEERDHIIPECRLEVLHKGVKHTMTIKDMSAIKNIVAAMRANPKPIPPRLKLHKNKNGGWAGPLPAKA